MYIRKVLLLALGAVAFGFSTAQAGDIAPGGRIIGKFSDPVLSGNVVNAQSLGQSTYYSNPGATWSINNSSDGTTGSALVWGSMAPGGVGTFSVLTFFGADIPAGTDIYNTPFLAGTLTYLNGTSDLTSLIFGALSCCRFDGHQV